MKTGTLDLGDYRLVVCLGPGGVGKTTLSAALALNAALSGVAVDVMTVDPAPRLLDALGLEGDAVAPRPIALAGLRAKPGGRLRAMKLDPKRIFDRLVERHAPSAAARDAILADRIYRNLSNAMAGVAEYMAMEQLLELHRHDPNNLIVLDTPPARDALDFLDAPRRMLELLNSRALTLLGASRERMRGPFGLFDLAARAVLAAFDRLTGLHLLTDVQAFVRRFEGMYSGFAERAAAAQTLLRDPATFIVVVTTPDGDRIDQARGFVAELDAMGLRSDAVVVNRVMAPMPDAAEIRRADLPGALKRKLVCNLEDFGALKRRETAALDQLRKTLPPASRLIVAPDLGYEPRTLKHLAEIAASFQPNQNLTAANGS